MTISTSPADQRTSHADASDADSTSLAHIDDAECRRYTGALELIGRRWNSGILLALARGHERFREIRDAVSGLSDRLLAQRLKELEAAELVARTVIPSTPVQIRYALTERGETLLRATQPIVAWGRRWR